jgi:hypothetical protein
VRLLRPDPPALAEVAEGLHPRRFPRSVCAVDGSSLSEDIDVTGYWANAAPQVLYADAGYDAEWIHKWVQDNDGQSFIKPVMHRKDGTLGGELRSRMTRDRLKEARYGRRWNIECFFSALKRKEGSTLSSRRDDMLLKEAIWKVLAYTLHR